jgi:carboxyl-terminal processing protease
LIVLALVRPYSTGAVAELSSGTPARGDDYSTIGYFGFQEAAQPGTSQRGQPGRLPVLRLELNGSLFENVSRVLARRYFDERFREKELPALVDEFTAKAKGAATLSGQRQVVHEMLGRMAASHLGLLSKRGFENIVKDLSGRPYPRFGFQLVEVADEQYAYSVLEGGPAARAGVLPWDRVVSIDDVPAAKCKRIDWRTDDSYLSDDRDPPVRAVLAEEGDEIRLKLERKRGQFLKITVRAESYSAFDAAKASSRIYKDGNFNLAYIHFWYVHLIGVPQLLKEKLETEYASCDALIFDLRGRGGGGTEIEKILKVLGGKDSKWRRPIVALVDRQSRSAKEVLAYEFRRTGLARLVGEETAGAVIPATFADVGHDTILMFPSFKLPRYTELLELKPVAPDVRVARAGPYSAGRDPILAKGREEAVRMCKASAQPSGKQSQRKGAKTQEQQKELDGLAGCSFARFFAIFWRINRDTLCQD